MDKQEFIMNKCLTLVDEVGLEQLSMRKIADSCEMPLSSLYTHYKSKNELLNAMFEYALSKTSVDLYVAEETLEKHIQKMYLFFIEKKLFFRYISKYFKSSFMTEETKADHLASMKKRKEEINKHIAHLIRDDVDFEVVDFLFHAIIKEIVIRDVVDEKFINNLIDCMVNGIAKERNVN